MIGTICVTAAYSNVSSIFLRHTFCVPVAKQIQQTTKLGEAYGVCVILVTFITTSMVSLVALIIWRLHFIMVLLGFLIFGTLDGIYLSSALTKVPDGAWFTLGLAIILSSIFVLWRYGKENQWHAETEDRIPTSHLLIERQHEDTKDENKSALLCLAPSLGGAPISHLRGVGIFFDKTGSPNGTPTVFIHFLQKFQATTTVAIFFHIRALSTPTVLPEDRFSVSRCFPFASGSMALQHMYRVTIRHGYSDNVLTGDLGALIYENVRNFIIHEDAVQNPHPSLSQDPSPESSSSSSTPSEPTKSTISQSLEALKAAYEDQVVYIVGKEQMRISEVNNSSPAGWARKIALAAFLWLRSNTGSRVANMDLDVEKLVEVGFVKVI